MRRPAFCVAAGIRATPLARATLGPLWLPPLNTAIATSAKSVPRDSELMAEALCQILIEKGIMPTEEVRKEIEKVDYVELSLGGPASSRAPGPMLPSGTGFSKTTQPG